MVALTVSSSIYAQDVSFSIMKAGEGEQTLIFIPGLACPGEVWNETIDELKNNFTCYVLTMPGFAGVAPEADPSFEQWKAQIVAFIKQEEIEKPILIGHSLGGGLALAIVSDYPGLCEKIVVVDALPCLAALTNPNFQSIQKTDCSFIIDKMKSMNDEQFAQMQKINTATLLSDTLRFEEVLNWSLASDRMTLAKMYCDFSTIDLRDQIKNVIVPSLILLEPPFKNMDTEINSQYRNLSSTKIEYATKGLHFIMYDDWEWFIKKVKDFLKEN